MWWLFLGCTEPPRDPPPPDRPFDEWVVAVAHNAMASEEELGDLLLSIVAASRERGWDAEAALREAVRRQVQRIRDAEGA